MSLQELLARLPVEDELAGRAALMSNVAHHYDRTAGALLACGDPKLLPELFKLVRDDRQVRRLEPPSLPIDGGYGKTYGPITVGDKARFLIGRLLPPEAKQPFTTWYETNKARLQWDPEAQRYKLRARP